jgi:hypothetical protein
MEKNDENAVPKENEKRWLDVDTAEKGMDLVEV